MFNVEDIEFEIAKAELIANIRPRPTRLVWRIEIKAMGRTIDLAGSPLECKPSASAELMTTEAGEVAKWTEMTGRRVAWEESSECEEPRASLYFCEHNPIYSGVVELRKGVSQPIGLDWSGHTNLYLDASNKNRYWEKCRLGIRCDLSFVLMAGTMKTEEETRELIRPFLHDDNLVYMPNPSRLVPRHQGTIL